MLNQLRGWEWLILLALVLLLFGAKRLPDTARGLGRSLRIFKAETRGLASDEPAAAEAASGTPLASIPPVEAAAPALARGTSDGGVNMLPASEEVPRTAATDSH